MCLPAAPPIMVTLTIDPAEMARRGCLGAAVLHARHDPTETTAPARAAFLRRFDDEVDPDRVLPEEERARRTILARKVYFTRLALASARVRKQRAEAVQS